MKELGEDVLGKVEAAGGKGIVFGTPVISDAITMGMEVLQRGFSIVCILTYSISLFAGNEILLTQQRFDCRLH